MGPILNVFNKVVPAGGVSNGGPDTCGLSLTTDCSSSENCLNILSKIKIVQCVVFLFLLNQNKNMESVLF